MTITFARSLLLLLALAAGITGAKTRQAAAQTNASQGLSCPQPYYESGFDRVGLRGSKSALKDAVQRGEAIRLGWAIDFDGDGTADLSHWSPASFLTVWEGEVFAQVTAIHRQRPRRGEATVALPADYEEWRGLLGTDGRLQGAFSSGRAASEVAVRIVWCPARVPAPAWVPLFTNGTGGEVLSGSKKALFAAIRAGLPLQIGWGLARDGDGARKSVEHVITPDFVTIVDGEHVVAQLPEHIAQRSYWSAEGRLFRRRRCSVARGHGDDRQLRRHLGPSGDR